jgi:ABC-type antimicrobial peptide transport system permease subunit
MGGLLTQSLVLADLGGAAGLALGAWTQGLLREKAGEHSAVAERWPDWHVFVFTAVASLTTVAIFGVVPAWQVGRSRPNEVIKGHRDR